MVKYHTASGAELRGVAAQLRRRMREADEQEAARLHQLVDEERQLLLILEDQVCAACSLGVSSLSRFFTVLRYFACDL